MIIGMGIIFIMVGIIVWGFLMRLVVIAYRSKQWPFVLGTITQGKTKEIVVRSVGEHNGGHGSIQVDYCYTYVVNGIQYQSKRVTLSDNMVKTGGSLKKILQKYAEGNQVKVFYDPEEHQYSVLKPGPTFYNFGPLITPSGFVAIGVWLVFFLEN